MDFGRSLNRDLAQLSGVVNLLVAFKQLVNGSLVLVTEIPNYKSWFTKMGIFWKRVNIFPIRKF